MTDRREYQRNYQKRVHERSHLLEDLYNVFDRHASQIAPLLAPGEIETLKRVQGMIEK